MSDLDPLAFVGLHGGPARGSASSAPPRTYRGVERIVLPRDAVEAWRVAPRGPASVLLVDPAGTNLIAQHDNCVVVVEPYGVRQYVGAEAGPWLAVACEEGLVYGPSVHRWGEPNSIRLGARALFSGDRYEQLAVWLTADRWLTAVAAQPTWGAPEIWVESRGRARPDVAVPHQGVASEPDEPDDAQQDEQDEVDRPRWRTRLEGEGTAAIDPTGRLALTDASHLRVYAVEGAQGRGVIAVERPIRTHTYAVSAGAPGSSLGWILLAAADHGPEVPSDHLRRRRLLHGDQLQQRWHTMIDALDPTGAVRWSATLPFEVRQPAIWAGGERLAFAGMGLTMIEHGKARWQLPSEHPMAATAFGDGSLAVAVGAAVWIVDPDGRRRQTVEIPDGERIVSQPAIGADGSVYVATETKIHALR